MKENPSYWAVIPANVRYDKRLTLGAKMLFGEIESLRRKEGYCWARDKYFAELYNVTTRTINSWISQLKKCGYIKTFNKTTDKGIYRKIFVQDIVPEVVIDDDTIENNFGRDTKIISINNTIN